MCYKLNSKPLTDLRSSFLIKYPAPTIQSICSSWSCFRSSYKIQSELGIVTKSKVVNEGVAKVKVSDWILNGWPDMWSAVSWRILGFELKLTMVSDKRLNANVLNSAILACRVRDPTSPSGLQSFHSDLRTAVINRFRRTTLVFFQ